MSSACIIRFAELSRERMLGAWGLKECEGLTLVGVKECEGSFTVTIAGLDYSGWLDYIAGSLTIVLGGSSRRSRLWAQEGRGIGARCDIGAAGVRVESRIRREGLAHCGLIVLPAPGALRRAPPARPPWSAQARPAVAWTTSRRPPPNHS